MDVKLARLLSRQYVILGSTNSELIVKSKRGPSHPTKIPLQMNNDLAFFIGVIIGDGHLRTSKKRIVLELTNKQFIELTKSVAERVFGININIHKRSKIAHNKKQSYYFNIDNAMIHTLLIYRGILAGKKSASVEVPLCIKNSSEEIKRYFLCGVLLAEGGKRHAQGDYGMSSASQKFRDGISELLKELDIAVSKDQWLNRKYKKRYFGLYFKEDSLLIMQGCRSGQTGRILDVRFAQEGQA